MRFKSLALWLAAAFAAITSLSSCSPKHNLPYFTDIITESEGVLPEKDFMPVIKPDDELVITVTASNPEATALYSIPFTNPASRDELVKTISPRTLTYIVDTKGDIDFPILGKIHAAGLTTEQLQSELTKLISKDVTDPIVRVSLANFRITVAGEVKDPTTINVSRNRISLLDALAEAGDLTEYGDRTNVLVIREIDGQRKYAHLNLNSSEVLNSPYYYLQQNDYVYVAPNKIREGNSRYSTNNAYKLQVVSIVVSACSVVASLVIALTR